MIILAVAALIAVMMAVPTVAQAQDEDKCADAEQELAQALESGDEKEIEKADQKVAEKCTSLP